MPVDRIAHQACLDLLNEGLHVSPCQLELSKYSNQCLL